MVHNGLLNDVAKCTASQPSAGLENKIFAAFELERQAGTQVCEH
jgi:hypothetical protein